MLKRISQEDAHYYMPLVGEQYNKMQRAVAFTLTDLGDGWERVDYYGESIFDPSGAIRKPEWVYVLVNKDIPISRIAAIEYLLTERDSISILRLLKRSLKR